MIDQLMLGLCVALFSVLILIDNVDPLVNWLDRRAERRVERCHQERRLNQIKHKLL